MLRPAQQSELNLLKEHSIPTGGERQALVLERDGVVAGAVSVLVKPFESDLLERRVAQIDAIEAWDRPGDLEVLAGEALDAISGDGVDLVACRRPESDRLTLNALQRAGMCVVECLITLTHPLDDPPAVETDAARQEPADADGCAVVAARAFRYDRFHADPLVDDTRADILKATWARNSVLSRADKVFVIRENGRIVGFNACMLHHDTASIDLIGVDPDFQGRGLGRRLTGAALAHYASRANRMTVGTQSANHASLALYQRAGFIVHNSALTLHAHLS